MTNSLSATELAVSGMKSQAVRLRHISENIANADTPGYRRKLVAFREQVDFGRPTGAVTPGPPRFDRRELPRIHDPAHPMADEEGYYSGSNVDLIIEIADAKEAGRSYEANLRVFEQSRQMGSSLLDLIRR
ncbi:flagellar basal body rod protein FlgC [Paracoccus denitrificans]|jgi:flagellar basal-body rod protein FlgC|uniref:Flagellar basal body rod protein n=1 Tax=Paracoccus denitrificans (strain Pd 1222) TaxID=318586 RepID=A1B3V9_PARDP|nr:flagellar basal body rod protein FlgC [Paracoccus denitrificans]ABL70203.1 flagellar basal body rod protein [Paracoccus denitrificans PD1222]MBB4629728.1 flagellar basal-body rod protein FlgC [Paracoccus denitrificans]MCU7430408.1 flagellar basal body rod protein FlgC [Paracoccus denitrificans]QAR25557.1 flagellar basal body rod protein FlgC [Paracoccus denitrificans]UPV94457.1 flagellar basal body rod protein FlgC [Paracoccus denitrificans]